MIHTKFGAVVFREFSTNAWKMNEKEVAAFIADYNSTSHEQISFAWNHKHADDFHDANDVLRQQVIDVVLENQDTASLDLIADLFEAEANWSKAAWCIRDSFSELGSTLLNRGGIERIDSFLESFAQSFDSWSACHVMSFNSTTIESLIEELKKRLLQTDDERVRSRLTLARELFEKHRAGNPAKGLIKVSSGGLEDLNVVNKPESWISKIKRFLFGVSK